MKKDLHELPKFEDGTTFLFVEHCKIEQDQKAIALFDESGKTTVPCASLSLLMLGPGTSITHAGIRTLAENGCLVIWSGEEGIRFYAQGMGETRSSKHLLTQARMVSNPELRIQVVRRMYEHRFKEKVDPQLTIQQLRGKEGARVKDTYLQFSKETGIPWKARNYVRDNWQASDPVNKALSTANSCLYGICHAAIVSAGYSPALGFIHTGKQLSFVYDIADLYKTEITIPLSFQVVKQGNINIERRARTSCRDIFKASRLLSRIIPDIHYVVYGKKPSSDLNDKENIDYDTDMTLPGDIWDPETGPVKGGKNFDDL